MSNKVDILQEIVSRTKDRIELQKMVVWPQNLIDRARALPVGDFPFERALKTNRIDFICEIKKASPSKGVICEDFDHMQIARDYMAQGAAAISVLTEPFYFHGNDSYLKDIAKAQCDFKSSSITIPLLRKDFTVDEYMIYEAKVLGASAILLICSVLDKDKLTKFIGLAHSLGLSSLVETHDEYEVETALSAGARIIGVNNRNLKTFEVDISLSKRLRKLVPKDVLFVAESGIQTREDVEAMREVGVNAVLVGEALMRGTKLECLM